MTCMLLVVMSNDNCLTKDSLTLFFAGASVCSTVCAVDEDISQCASSAANGFNAWSALTCHQRAKVLLRYKQSHLNSWQDPQHPLFFLPAWHVGVCACCPSFSYRLVSVIGQHSQCLSELCELCGASCSPSTLVRLLQYYGSWAQLRDTLITNWAPLGEVIQEAFTKMRFNHPPVNSFCLIFFFIFCFPGVVAVVVSDDCSLYSLLLKVIPALAMGNMHTNMLVFLSLWGLLLCATFPFPSPTEPKHQPLK